MKITSKKLRQIIKEELGRLTEQTVGGGSEFGAVVGLDRWLDTSRWQGGSRPARARVEELRQTLRDQPMNTEFTALDLMNFPRALTPQMQEMLSGIQMKKVAVVDGTTIISFGEDDDIAAITNVVEDMIRLAFDERNEQGFSGGGDTVLGGVFGSGDISDEDLAGALERSTEREQERQEQSGIDRSY